MLSYYRNNQFFGELVRFLVSGALAVFTQFVVLICLVELGGLNKTFSSGLGFSCGGIVNYLLLYFWAFKSNGQHHLVVFKYLIAMCFSLSINVTVFWTLTEKLGIWYPLSQCGATTVSSVFSFLINKYFTFVKEE